MTDTALLVSRAMTSKKAPVSSLTSTTLSPPTQAAVLGTGTTNFALLVQKTGFLTKTVFVFLFQINVKPIILMVFVNLATRDMS